MQNKVTIISPVYNGEKYIARFIESVINQSYKNIRLIIIDDGSTDQTKKIIDSYIKKHKEINIQYIYQINSGQASAMKNAIKFVDTEYFSWADSDDYYEKDAIKTMVDYLKKNKNMAIVRGNAVARDQNNINTILYKMDVKKKYQKREDIFEDCIFIRGINCFSGIYMMRFDKYKERNPKLYFYTNKEGQNWQLLLPVLYKNRCGYLDKTVYNYVIRKESHSHRTRTTEENIKRLEGLKDILKNTINNIATMGDEEKKNIFIKIDDRYNKDIMRIFFSEGNINMLKNYYKKIHKKDLITMIVYIIGKNIVLYKIYKKFKYLLNDRSNV